MIKYADKFVDIKNKLHRNILTVVSFLYMFFTIFMVFKFPKELLFEMNFYFNNLFFLFFPVMGLFVLLGIILIFSKRDTPNLKVQEKRSTINIDSIDLRKFLPDTIANLKKVNESYILELNEELINLYPKSNYKFKGKGYQAYYASNDEKVRIIVFKGAPVGMLLTEIRNSSDAQEGLLHPDIIPGTLNEQQGFGEIHAQFKVRKPLKDEPIYKILYSLLDYKLFVEICANDSNVRSRIIKALANIEKQFLT